MTASDAYIPYCGAPAAPLDLWTRWTLEPGLLVGLALAGLLIALRAPRERRWMAWTGWALVAIAFVSPLCALSMALFAARVGQHLLLTLVAAPLLAAGLGLGRRAPPPLAAALVFAVLFQLWHAPAPYAATLRSDLLYWTMHLSLLASATAFWAGVLFARPARMGAAAAAAVATGAQMSLLAAALTVSVEPWHAWHVAGARLWGMTALADQQVAAGLMWVGGALAGAAAAACAASGWFRRVDAEAA